MRGFVIHAVVYGVVNALLVGAWLVTTGSVDILNDSQRDPIRAFRDGMWPLAVMAVWGGGLVIHGTVVITSLPRRATGRQAHGRRERPRPAVDATKPPSPAQELGHHAVRAAVGLVENLAARGTTAPSREPHRPWITAMFTDLVGSTDLAERLGDGAWHTMLADHRALVRGCIGAHAGTEVGTQGDGFLVRFVTSDAAVSCAIAIQRQMASRRDSGELTPDLRIGIHAGEAVADDNDLVGKVINLASRVTSAAGRNEIVITEPVADHASPGLVLEDRGLVPLKGIAQPRHLLAVDWHVDANRPASSSLEEDNAGQNESGGS